MQNDNNLIEDYKAVAPKMLAVARAKSKYSQRETAELLHIDIKTYGEYERGKSDIPFSKLLKAIVGVHKLPFGKVMEMVYEQY